VKKKLTRLHALIVEVLLITQLLFLLMLFVMGWVIVWKAT
jgi:hypothetical protein